MLAPSPLTGVDVYTLRIYTPQSFEWDPTKRRTNLEKHRIDFVDAVRIFEAPVLEREDRRRDYGEPRFLLLGAVEELILRSYSHPAGRTPDHFSARGEPI